MLRDSTTPRPGLLDARDGHDLHDDVEGVADKGRAAHVELHVHERQARPREGVRLDHEPLAERIHERAGHQPSRVTTLGGVTLVVEERLVEAAQVDEGGEVALGHRARRGAERAAHRHLLPGVPVDGVRHVSAGSLTVAPVLWIRFGTFDGGMSNLRHRNSVARLGDAANMSLAGRVVLVTGGARGIGAAVAAALAAERAIGRRR